MRNALTPVVRLLAVSSFFAFANLSAATVLDDIGVTALRQLDPTLTGAGIAVAQPEAGTAWEVNPSVVGWSSNTVAFSYANFNTQQYAFGVFPNSVGSESGHANAVGNNFYGAFTGVAPGVSSIDNYNADSYVSNVIVPARRPSAINASLHDARVVNQSFAYSSQITSYDKAYDAYAAAYNVLFVSAVGNGGPVNTPATCYNGIAVGCSDIPSGTVGPTGDGRSKPDISAPGGGYTSYATPYVSGAAAVLMQAAARGDGGAGTQTAAGDIRTIKALLLNGATKPTGWTHTATQPLDPQYGAGELNVFNSYQQLRAGNQAFSSAGSVSLGAVQVPSATLNGRATIGWDEAQLTSSSTQDALNNYIVAPSIQSGVTYSFTATLVWNRQTSGSIYTLNNLDICLYDVTTQSLISSSISTVDNVEHIYTGWLRPSDTYAIQVRKRGGTGVVSNTETYSLAYSFAPVALPSLIGDANGDGTVNSSDLGVFFSHYNELVPNGTDGWSLGDFNVDGTINSTDMGLLLAHYNQQSPAATALPEPSALLLVALGFLGILAYARRR